MRFRLCIIVAVLACLANIAAPPAAPAPASKPRPVTIDLDASEAGRRILHAKLVIPARPGAMTLVLSEVDSRRARPDRSGHRPGRLEDLRRRQEHRLEAGRRRHVRLPLRGPRRGLGDRRFAGLPDAPFLGGGFQLRVLLHLRAGHPQLEPGAPLSRRDTGPGDPLQGEPDAPRGMEARDTLARRLLVRPAVHVRRCVARDAGGLSGDHRVPLP